MRHHNRRQRIALLHDVAKVVAPGEVALCPRVPEVGRLEEPRRRLHVVLLQALVTAAVPKTELRLSHHTTPLRLPDHQRRAFTRRHHGPVSTCSPRRGLHAERTDSAQIVVAAALWPCFRLSSRPESSDQISTKEMRTSDRLPLLPLTHPSVVWPPPRGTGGRGQDLVAEGGAVADMVWMLSVDVSFASCGAAGN